MNYGNQAAQMAMSTENASVYPMDLYDTVVYPAAGLTSDLILFSTPQGQGQTAVSGAALGVKTAFDTNLVSAGILPSGKKAEVHGMYIKYEAGQSPTTPTGFKSALPIQSIADTTSTATGANIPLPANEVALMLNNLHAQFIVGDKVICESRLYRFPPPTDVRIDSSIAAASSITGIRSTANAVTEGDVWTFGAPLILLPTMNFSVRIKAVGQIATLTTFNGRITAGLLCNLFAAAQ